MLQSSLLERKTLRKLHNITMVKWHKNCKLTLHSHSHVPLLPTDGAPTTATFTSDSEDFFRLIPLVVIVGQTTPDVRARGFSRPHSLPQETSGRLLKIHKATLVVLIGQDLAKIIEFVFTSSWPSVAAGQRHRGSWSSFWFVYYHDCQVRALILFYVGEHRMWHWFYFGGRWQ